MGKRGFTMDTPFIRFLTKNGFGPDDLGPHKSTAIRLARTPEKVAPNSPMLPALAAFLSMPLKLLQSFAKGPPMSPQFEKKIRLQMERGTLPHGNQHSKAMALARLRRKPKPHTPMQTSPPDLKPKFIPSNASPLVRFLAEKGFSLSKLSEPAKIPIATLWKISAGAVPPNHPVLQMLADVVQIPVSEIAAFMKEPPAGPEGLARAERLVARYKAGIPLRGRKPGPVPKGAPKGKRGRKPGVALALRGVPRPPVVQDEDDDGNGRRHNRLGSKRTALNLRDSARAMVATLNISIMRGDTHMPPLPVGDLYLVLQDYLLEKGIKQNMLVDPAFAKLFDPR